MSTITESFCVLMQKGIQSGIALPTLPARFLVVRIPKRAIFTVASYIRHQGAPDFELIKTKELKIVEYAEDIATFQAYYRDIPTQYTEVQDLYGLDTSLVQATEPTAYWDLYLSGERAPRGIPHPTEEQKVKFEQAVAIIERWAATDSGD